MKTIRTLPAVLLLLAFGMGASAAQDALNNDTIIMMTEGGLGETVIVAAIRGAAATDFNLGPIDLVNLKSRGVADAVLAAMIEAGGGAAAEDADRPAPGIYLLRDDGSRTPLEPTAFSATGGSGLRRRFTFGLVSDEVKAVVARPSAVIRARQPRPRFLFVFPTGDAASPSSVTIANAWSAWWYDYGTGLTSPNEFVLAQFYEEDGQRELGIGRSGDVSSTRGIDGERSVSITFQRLEPGVYEVVPDEDLTAGEYCFMPLLNDPSFNRLFDFGVDGQ